MSARTPGRKPAPKHFWSKWEFHRWLNEPTLVAASTAVKGFWFTLLNRMMVADCPTLEAPAHEYALLGLCREAEVAALLLELRTRLIADVHEHNGTVRVTCRSMVRQMEISKARSEAGKKSAERRASARMQPDLPGISTAAPGTPQVREDGVLLTDLLQQNTQQASNSGFNSSSVQKEEVQEEKPAPAQPDDIQPIVTQIVLAHPKARMRHWQPVDVAIADRKAVTAAVELEAQQRGQSPMQAALYVLDRVNELATHTPEDRWKFLKEIPKSMEAREYRMEAKHLQNGGNDGKSASDRPSSGARPSPAAERHTRSLESIWAAAQFFAGPGGLSPDGAGAEPVPESDPGRPYSADVDGGMAGAGDALRNKPPGRVLQGFVSGRDATGVLSHTG